MNLYGGNCLFFPTALTRSDVSLVADSVLTFTSTNRVPFTKTPQVFKLKWDSVQIGLVVAEMYSFHCHNNSLYFTGHFSRIF